jgi:DNA-binding SARP family transcriptional activator
MSTLEIRTLGAFSVRFGGKPVSPEFWDGRRASLIFQTLVAAPEFRVAQETLADMFWPASTIENSRMNLAGRIAELRGVFKGLEGRPGDDFPITVGNGFVAIDPAIELTIDARRLEQQLRIALETEPASSAFQARALEALETGDAEYLPALDRDEVLEMRRRIARGRVALANRLLQVASDDAAVRAAALRVLQQQPQDEALAIALIDAILRVGERDRALEAYERHARALAASGLEPAADLRLRIAPHQRGSARVDRAQEQHALLGRDAEMRELGALLEAAPPRTSTILELHGRRGVGRSRLLGALVEHARMRGSSVGIARGTATDPTDVVLHDLVRSLTAQVGASDRKRKRLVPPDSIVRFGDVDAAVEALVSAARWAAGAGHVLLALDDADFVAQAAIEDVAGALIDDPAFPGSSLPVRRSGCKPLLPHARQCAIAALSEADAAQLLADRFGDDLDAQTRDEIQAQWPGSLTRQRALAQEATRADRARDGGAVPASLRIEVESRFAALTPGAQAFLAGTGEADPDVIDECDRAGLLGERDGRPVVPPIVRRIHGI